MRILQFHLTSEEALHAAQRDMLATITAWSLLSWRAANNPEQVTKAWGSEIFNKHTTDQTLFWVDWGAIYPHLGEIGQALADVQIVGTSEMPGVLIGTPLGFWQVTLELVEVADLVAAGYLPEPESTEP
jgi:hypothetical protein